MVHPDADDPDGAAAGFIELERPFARLPETDSGELLALEKIKIMLEVMEAHTGKRPIIYTDVAFHREVLEGELPGYNFWLRSVAAEPQEIYRLDLGCSWQFTTTGYVPGIEKPVDRNVFNGSFGDWRQVLPARPPAKQSVRNAN